MILVLSFSPSPILLLSPSCLFVSLSASPSCLCCFSLPSHSLPVLSLFPSVPLSSLSNISLYFLSLLSLAFPPLPPHVPLYPQGLAVARAITINVAAGADFEAECLHKVQPGDTCYLEKGDYLHDGLTVTHGTAEQPITITGDSSACIKGSNTQDRAFQVAHDYYILDGICFDGDHDGEYVATAVYVLGEDMKTTKNGVTSSVTGLQMLNLEIRNFGSECIHFRYYVTHAEVYGCTIQNCGVDDFVNGGGAKVGEGLYMGTALDQINDNKVSTYFVLFWAEI